MQIVIEQVRLQAAGRVTRVSIAVSIYVAAASVGLFLFGLYVARDVPPAVGILLGIVFTAVYGGIVRRQTIAPSVLDNVVRIALGVLFVASIVLWLLGFPFGFLVTSGLAGVSALLCGLYLRNAGHSK